MKYQDINAKSIDTWCESGWEWGKAISHEEYEEALNGKCLSSGNACPKVEYAFLK